MASIPPWIYSNYRFLVQDSMHSQVQVANSFDVASAMALIRARVATRHTEASGTEPRAVGLDSANRRLESNILEPAIQQMRAGVAAAGSSSTSNQQRSRLPLRPCRQLDSAEEKESLDVFRLSALRTHRDDTILPQPGFPWSHLANNFVIAPHARCT